MKVRLIIAACLFVVTLIAVAVAFAGVGVHCSRSFYMQDVPLVCADVQPGASSLIKITYDILSWILLLGLPTLPALLYAHFGWPRSKLNK